MTRFVGLASTEGASHHWQKEVPLSLNYAPQDVKPGQNRKPGREESPPMSPKPSGRRPECSIHRPNPYTLERTNRPDDPTRPDSPPLSYLLPGDSEVDSAEAIHIERSYTLLEETAKTLNRSVGDLTYMCHWQVGGTKFCETSVSTKLVSVRTLGKGSVDEVDEVQVAGMGEAVEHFVRKRITISRQKRTADRELKAVANEVDNLKKVHVHPHIVTIIGSYREETAQRVQLACLLTYPVGDQHLEDFFEAVYAAREELNTEKLVLYRLWLKKWFCCLSSALTFMHKSNVHHKDIKPKNVIHCGDRVYFTDFSSSRSFEAGQSTSTASFAQATRLFAAPEACHDDPETIQRHGSKADVFSLGLLFVEMLTVLAGNNTYQLRDFVDQYNGFADTHLTRQYWRVVDRFEDWFSIGKEKRVYDRCIKPMLAKEKSERLSAEEASNGIRKYQPWTTTMACPCKDSINL